MSPSGFSVILVPTEQREPPRAALDIACALARPGARLIVACVGVDPDETGAGVPRERLTIGRPDDDSTLRIEVVARYGPAVEAVVGLADELGCELIVISDDGPSCEGIERLLMGNVGQEVLRHAACPVLCLPAAGPFLPTTASDPGLLRID